MTIKNRPKRRKNKRRLTAVLVAAVVILTGGTAAAKDFYYYRDSRGVIHFTDAPTDSRFRPYKVKGVVRVGSGTTRLDPELVMPYVLMAAREFGLDPALIKAVIRVESAFDPNAVSWAGAQGLMQLMPGTADLMNVRNVFSPKENIRGGSKYLRRMLDRFGGDKKLALAAYNIGPERVAKEKKVPKVRETQAYVKRVLQYYDIYKKN